MLLLFTLGFSKALQQLAPCALSHPSVPKARWSSDESLSYLDASTEKSFASISSKRDAMSLLLEINGYETGLAQPENRAAKIHAHSMRRRQDKDSVEDRGEHRRGLWGRGRRHCRMERMRWVRSVLNLTSLRGMTTITDHEIENKLGTCELSLQDNIAWIDLVD